MLSMKPRMCFFLTNMNRRPGVEQKKKVKTQDLKSETDSERKCVWQQEIKQEERERPLFPDQWLVSCTVPSHSRSA